MKMVHNDKKHSPASKSCFASDPVQPKTCVCF